MNRRNFIKRGALFLPTIFVPRLIRGQADFYSPQFVAGLQSPSTIIGGGGLDLTTGLVVYWNCEDAATQNIVDSVAALTLTGNSRITEGTGIIGKCVQTDSGGSPMLTCTSNSTVQMGDNDFTLFGWFYLDSLPSSSQGRTIVSKYDVSSGNREYAVYVENSSGTTRVKFTVSNNGTTITTVLANSLGTPSTGTWYFFVAWHDAANNTISIQVNNGTVDSTAHSAGIFSGSAIFSIGSLANTANYYMRGRIDEIGIYKNRILTSDERTALYNSGAGKNPLI